MNIGVVITTFNSEDTIKECINSLISKKIDNSFKLKIIVVDDCSTDSTKNIISDYYSKGLISKAIYLSLNKGISAARNKGISECNDVDNIMFVDGDDSINIDFFDIASYEYETIIVHNKNNFEYNYTNYDNDNTRTIIKIGLRVPKLKTAHAVCLINDNNIGYYYDSLNNTFGYFYNKKLLYINNYESSEY